MPGERRGQGDELVASEVGGLGQRIESAVERGGDGARAALPCRLVRHFERGKPVDEMTPPEGVININGEWFYEEYTAGSGVRELASEPNVPGTTTEDEKKSILDLFKR